MRLSGKEARALVRPERLRGSSPEGFRPPFREM